jgi:Holliday junction resolvase RusA-like endonuclease
VTTPPASSEGIGAALKRAFTWHWHLLGLGAGVAVAVLSGAPVLCLPFIAAAEIGYLGLLGLHPRFQAVLKGKSMATANNAAAKDAAQRFQQLMSFLSPADETRFGLLHKRCAELLDLRRRMDAKETDAGVDDFRAESLDRMLWLFLKLLHQRSGLERFLGATKRSEIEAELRTAEEQMKSAQERDKAAGLPEGRLATSIGERIKTIRERLDNYQKATEGLELVTAEIDKTEQQITHLCEVGMTMRDSAGLSVQIDSISASLQSSESTFAHASIAQILDDETAPPLLSGNVVAASPPPLRKMVRQ